MTAWRVVAHVRSSLWFVPVVCVLLGAGALVRHHRHRPRVRLRARAVVGRPAGRTRPSRSSSTIAVVDGDAHGAGPDHHHGGRPARDGAVLAAHRADDPARQAEPDRDRPLRRDVRPRDAGDARGALRGRRQRAGAGDRRRLRAGRGLDRRARALRPPHRPLAARLQADRARRHGHAAPARPRVPRSRPAGRARPAAAHLRRPLRRRRAHRPRAAGRGRARRRTAGSCCRRRSATSSPPAGRCSSWRARERPLREDDARRGVVLALERTLDQDVAYGFRMLVDIAERSLAESPYVDPTTAVQAIDRLHDGMRQLARRPFPDGRHGDEDGVAAARRPGDGLGRVRAPRLRRALPRRGALAPGRAPPRVRAGGPAHRRPARTASLPSTGSSASWRRPCTARTRPTRPWSRRSRSSPDRQGIGPAAGRALTAVSPGPPAGRRTSTGTAGRRGTARSRGSRRPAASPGACTGGRPRCP